MTEAVEGPSFPVGAKVLATLFMALLLVVGVRAFFSVGMAELDTGIGLLLLALTVIIGAAYWGVMTDRTRVDGQRIEQRGLWTRSVELSEITQLRLIEPPVLAWLVVTRLRVRTRGGGVMSTTIHLGDARVRAAVRLLAYGAPADGATG
jgi:hypothetical protein